MNIAVVSLNQQYRMNADIASLCTSLFYNNKMICGNDTVSHAKLQLPYWNNLLTLLPFMRILINVPINNKNIMSPPHITDISNEWLWLYECLNPTNSVVFLNTDTITSILPTHIHANPNTNISLSSTSSSTTSSSGSSNTTNILESHIIYQLLNGLSLMGLNIIESVGIITPYRAQIKTILNTLQQLQSHHTSSNNVNKANNNNHNNNHHHHITNMNHHRHHHISGNRQTSNDLHKPQHLSSTHITQLAEPSSSSSTTHHDCKLSQVEVTTVDKFQGRDMDVIILSSVHCLNNNTSNISNSNSNCNTSNTNSNNSIGEILKDWRRLNVALSRARTKLIIIGSLSLLSCPNTNTNIQDVTNNQLEGRKGFPELCDLVRQR